MLWDQKDLDSLSWIQYQLRIFFLLLSIFMNDKDKKVDTTAVPVPQSFCELLGGGA